MVRELIEDIAKSLVQHTDQVEVRDSDREGVFLLLLAPDDVGRVTRRTFCDCVCDFRMH